MKKIAILTSHPIQYQTPLFRKLAEQKDIDLIVYFCWDFGIRKTYDKQFGVEVLWDIPLLEKYKYIFLKNLSLRPNSDFWGQINPNIVSKIIKNKYNAILLYGWNSFTNWLAIFTAILTRTPFFIHSENPFNQELFKSKWKLKLKKIILGWLFQHAQYLPYIGKENKKFYKYYGVPDEKLIFMPYAVDNERLMKEAARLIPQKKQIRNDFNINEKATIVLFVGKLIDKKRPLDLLKAYELLQKKYNNLALVYVGDGSLKFDLEKYTKENNIKNIYFFGFQNQSILPKFYALAGIFVLPSEEGETWGLVINEAMCFRLPIIASNLVGCISDLVKNGENGFIFPVSNIQKLKEKIEFFINAPEKMEFFGRKSLEIIKDYNHKKDIESILSILKRNK